MILCRYLRVFRMSHAHIFTNPMLSSEDTVCRFTHMLALSTSNQPVIWFIPRLDFVLLNWLMGSYSVSQPISYSFILARLSSWLVCNLDVSRRLAITVHVEFLQDYTTVSVTYHQVTTWSTAISLLLMYVMAIILQNGVSRTCEKWYKNTNVLYVTHGVTVTTQITRSPMWVIMSHATVRI